MPPNHRSTSNVGNAVHSENENEMMAVKASQAAAQKMMNNDPKRYRDQIQATTNTYGWNTVETGVPIPAMPTYPAPLPPHQNIKLPLQQKLNKAISIYHTKGFNNARQYVIHTKVPEEYGTHAVSESIKNKNNKNTVVITQKKYTPEWIIAKESTKRRMQKEAKNRNNTMNTLRFLASAKGGHKQRTRKTRRNRKQ
jgi:hypothetical protein